MKEKKIVKVYYHNRLVGQLAEAINRRVAFQYDNEWLQTGFSISPFSLPLSSEVFISDERYMFGGLFGVFADSLPDGWGRLLVDRTLKEHGYDPDSISELFRLGLIGRMGLGALEYQPTHDLIKTSNRLSYDDLAQQCIEMFQNEDCEHLDDLFHKGGSSGGARPKVNVDINNELWIVKFATSFEDRSVGLMEYEYMKCAQSCGICVPSFQLLDSNWCDGYFAVKRFDRINGCKIHMISLSALLETSHRIPNLDYLDIFKVIALLTRDIRESEEMYRRMCFNVFAHNRDDHSKNFAFLYDEWQNRYTLSPAYDLTYSNSIGGEHATTIDGVGDHPGLNQLLSVAKIVGLNEKWAKQTALDIQQKVLTQLNRWLNHR